MLLSFHRSAQFPGAFAPLRLLLPFFHFKWLAQAVADVVCLLVFATLEEFIALVVVVVAAVVLVVVNVIFILNTIFFLHAPALTSTVALATVALLLSELLELLNFINLSPSR